MKIISDLFQKTREEVVAHVNEVKLGGDYKTEFNGSSLPSNVNFYELKAGIFFETMKIILLR